MQSFGIQINFKNGKKEWFSPCDQDPYFEDDKLIVSNIICTYEYISSDIQSWERYSICDDCGFDLRDEHHSPKCSQRQPEITE